MTRIDRRRHFVETTTPPSGKMARGEPEFDEPWRQRNQSGPLRRILDLVLLWHKRRRLRRQLAGLDDFTLKDIGVTRGDANREARKWFWEE